MLDVYVKDVYPRLPLKYHKQFLVTLNCVELYQITKLTDKNVNKYKLYVRKEPKIHPMIETPLKDNLPFNLVSEQECYRDSGTYGRLMDKLITQIYSIYGEWFKEGVKHFSKEELIRELGWFEEELGDVYEAEFDDMSIQENYTDRYDLGTESKGDYLGFFQAFFELNKLLWKLEPNPNLIKDTKKRFKIKDLMKSK